MMDKILINIGINAKLMEQIKLQKLDDPTQYIDYLVRNGLFYIFRISREFESTIAHSSCREPHELECQIRAYIYSLFSNDLFGDYTWKRYVNTYIK